MIVQMPSRYMQLTVAEAVEAKTSRVVKVWTFMMTEKVIVTENKSV
jgi:hypothetical protein